MVFHRTKLERGPTWPPHSRPSKTNRLAPLSRTTSATGRRDMEVRGNANLLQS